MNIKRTIISILILTFALTTLAFSLTPREYIQNNIKRTLKIADEQTWLLKRVTNGWSFVVAANGVISVTYIKDGPWPKRISGIFVRIADTATLSASGIWNKEERQPQGFARPISRQVGMEVINKFLKGKFEIPNFYGVHKGDVNNIMLDVLRDVVDKYNTNTDSGTSL